MDNIAFVFSGQGAQYGGMGKSLYDGSPAAKTLMDKLEHIRPGTLSQCFTATEEELKDTRNTQPCIFTVSLAATAALAEKGVSPTAVAGFSLGEVSALSFSGIFSLTDGFSLVIKRSELMAKAMAESAPSGMVAVMKLSATQVEDLAKGFTHVYPVNYNCPGQTVVAGDKEELLAFQQAVKEAGGRAIPLKVGGGFHCPYMAPAALAFEKVLGTFSKNTPRYPVYANLTAKPYGDNITKTLSKQMESPVQWQKTIENMLADGITTFIEVGPGKTLKGLIEKCTDQASVYHVEDMESLENTICALFPKGE